MHLIGNVAFRAISPGGYVLTTRPRLLRTVFRRHASVCGFRRRMESKKDSTIYRSVLLPCLWLATAVLCGALSRGDRTRPASPQPRTCSRRRRGTRRLVLLDSLNRELLCGLASAPPLHSHRFRCCTAPFSTRDPEPHPPCASHVLLVTPYRIRVRFCTSRRSDSGTALNRVSTELPKIVCIFQPF